MTTIIEGPNYKKEIVTVEVQEDKDGVVQVGRGFVRVRPRANEHSSIVVAGHSLSSAYVNELDARRAQTGFAVGPDKTRELNLGNGVKARWEKEETTRKWRRS